MNSNAQLLKTIAALASITLLSACGASNQSLNSSSTLPNTYLSSDKPLASCSETVGTDLKGRLQAVKDSAGNVRSDLVYLRLTALPSGFSSGSNYIAMWKWLANSSGYTYLDGTALEFKLINASTSQEITGWRTTLTWSDVSAAASNMGVADAQAFFNKVKIMVNLKDTKGEYDVLKVTSYESSTNKAVSQADGLIPLFYANPSDYAYESDGSLRADILESLHPLKSYTSQGFSGAQFKSMAEALCF